MAKLSRGPVSGSNRKSPSELGGASTYHTLLPLNDLLVRAAKRLPLDKPITKKKSMVDKRGKRIVDWEVVCAIRHDSTFLTTGQLMMKYGFNASYIRAVVHGVIRAKN